MSKLPVEATAFSSLATISADVAGLRDILVRMAFMNNSIISRAVLHAILALASLHRDGLHLQAVQHKTAAVGALAISAKNGVYTAAEAAQHVAANMLLCSFEVNSPPLYMKRGHSTQRCCIDPYRN
jgi:hypothetical protein